LANFTLDALRTRLINVSELSEQTGKNVTIRIFPVIHDFSIPEENLAHAFDGTNSVLLEMKPEILAHMFQGDSHCGIESNPFWHTVVEYLKSRGIRSVGVEGNMDACQMQYRYSLFWSNQSDKNVCCQIRIHKKSWFLRHIPKERYNPRKGYYNLACSEIPNFDGFLKKVSRSKNTNKYDFSRNYIDMFKLDRVNPDSRVIFYLAAPMEFYYSAITIDHLVRPLIAEFLSFIEDEDTREKATSGLAVESSNAMIEWCLFMYQRDRSAVKRILKEATFQLRSGEGDVTITYVCGALHEASLKKLLTLVPTNITIEIVKDERFSDTLFALPDFFIKHIPPDVISVLSGGSGDMMIDSDRLGDYITQMINDNIDAYERALLMAYLSKRWGVKLNGYQALKDYYAFEYSLQEFDTAMLAALVSKYPLDRKIIPQDLPLRA